MSQKSPSVYHGSNLTLEIRKFGPACCDLPTLIQNVNKLLRVITLNIDNKNKKPIPIKFYVFTVVTAAAYMYVFVVSATWFVLCRCIAVGDTIRAIIVFSLCIASELGNAKFIYIYFYRDVIREIVEESLKFDATNVSDSRFSKNILKVLRKTKVRAIVYWFVIIANGVFYVSKSLLRPGRHFMDEVFTLYGLEPMAKTPNYEFGYILVSASVWFLCYVPANVTAFLIIIAGYIEAQMLALSQELLHIWPDAVQYYQDLNLSILQRGTFIDVNYKKRIINEFVKNRLQDILRKHAMNVYLMQLLEGVFKGAIALEFILLVIGLIAELLGGLKNTYVQIPYAFFQVAMDCWTGQRVLDASATFEAALYASGWEQFNVANMKIVLLMLGSAQKSLKLSAGGVTMLSFASLMNVVRSIYSAYTTLESRI